MPLGSHVGSLWPTLERQQYILNSHHQGNPTVRPNNKTPPSYLKNILLQGRKICCLWCECFHQDDQGAKFTNLLTHSNDLEKNWFWSSFLAINSWIAADCWPWCWEVAGVGEGWEQGTVAMRHAKAHFSNSCCSLGSALTSQRRNPTPSTIAKWQFIHHG